MKRIIYIMAICVFALGMLSGCSGGTMKEMETGRDASGALTGAEVSGQAVSGQTVGEEADSPEKDAKKEEPEGLISSRCCTERYYYTQFDDGDAEESGDVYVLQISLATGKETKRIPVDGICEVINIEGDYLYYLMLNESNESYDDEYDDEYDDDEYDDDEYEYSLWRLPIERRKNGTEELRVDRREQIKGVDDIFDDVDDIYMDEQYIIYDGVEDLMCYDRKSGKKTRMPASSEAEDCMEGIVSIYRNDDRIDIVTPKGIVTWDIKTGDVTVVCESNTRDDYWPLSREDVCFYHMVDGKAVLRIDMQTKKKTDFVSEEEFCEALEEATGLSKEQMDFCMADMHYDQNRLYMKMSVTYKKGGKTCYQDVMLSREDAEGSPLKYERDLTEYMWGDNGSNARASWSEENDVERNWADCYVIRRGKAYIRWFVSEESDKADEIVYDLKTKKVRPAKAKEMIIFVC